MNDSSPSGEFRLRRPWWWLAGIPIAVAGQALLAGLLASLALRYSRIAGQTVPPAGAAGWQVQATELRILAVLLAASTMFGAYWFVRGWLETGRGLVRLDGSGITVIDWRRHRRHLPWADAEELRVATWGGLCGSSPIITLLGPAGPLRIHRWVRDRSALVEEVRRLANLERRVEAWSATRYLRPA